MKVLTVEEIQKAVIECMPKDFIDKVYLFGSYARGEADENSDVDLHIYTKNHCSLLKVSGYRLDLVEKLGVEVDMVFNQLSRESPFYRKFSDNVTAEEALLYGDQRT